MVRHGCLDERHELVLVAGKTARHESRPHAHGQADQVDGREFVHVSRLVHRSEIGRGGILPLGKAVTAVVHHHVGNVQVAADGVAELAQAYGCRIAVAAHAQVDQLAVGQVGPGGDGRHAPVHRVEAVRIAQKIRRCFRRTANARQLGQLMGFHRHLEAGLHDGPVDRVVSASGA